jgi:hypothetical protein
MKEYDLYVPLISNAGTPFPGRMLRGLKRRLIERFGGLTEFPQKQRGYWKLGKVTFRDEIIILRVLSDNPPATARRFWLEVKTHLKNEWGQAEVLIVGKNVTLT